MNEFKIYVNLLTNITEQALGLQPNTLNVRKKTDELVLGRMIVCNILMDGGLVPSKLCKVFVQDRSNYYHYRKQHIKYTENTKLYPAYKITFDKVKQEFLQRSNIKSLSDLLEKLVLIDDIDTTVNTLQQQRNLLQKSITL